MEQTDIFSLVFERVKQKVENLTNEKEMSKLIKTLDSKYEIDINDISQFMVDKNGEKVVLDEKLYEAPSYYQMIVAIKVFGKTLSSVLRLYGMIARYIKDEPKIDISDCNWMMSGTNSAYMDSVVGSPNPDRNSRDEDGNYNYVLRYEIIVGLNSHNAKEFVRVKDRTIGGKVM